MAATSRNDVNGHPRKAHQAAWGGFVHTGPGTLAGCYMRIFWHPVHRAQDLPAECAKPIRTMSEDLTLYRGHDGQPHLLSFRCAHRGTQLSTGVGGGGQSPLLPPWLDLRARRSVRGATGEARARAVRQRSQGLTPHDVLGAAVLRGELRIEDIEDRHVDGNRLFNLQDYASQVAQGAIADREHEHLGQEDVTLILQRQIWRRELRRRGAP